MRIRTAVLTLALVGVAGVTSQNVTERQSQNVRSQNVTSQNLPNGNERPVIVPCVTEDGSGGPLPCRWDGNVQGNGSGVSFDVFPTDTKASDGSQYVVYVYDEGYAVVGTI